MADSSPPPSLFTPPITGDDSLSPAVGSSVLFSSTTAVTGDDSPSSAKEDLLPVGDKIAELNDSQSELLGRLRGLKEDLQSWRNNLDTQVKKYKDELLDIKGALNTDIEQLRLDFQELRTTLKKQQEDVTVSLRSLGLQDTPENHDANEDKTKVEDAPKEETHSDARDEDRPSDDLVT